MEAKIPVHPFDFSPKNLNAGVRPEPVPAVPSIPTNVPNLNRIQPAITTASDPINTATEDVEDIFPVGFKTMDRGIKEFFQNIDVPTKDGTRPLEIRIAGGDKTILFWKQLMEEDNRIKLPVMSINRTGCKLNPERHTPASVGPYFYRKFADSDGTRMSLAPREYSVLINYSCSVWTERKRDMEHILFQIMSRFNPIAEWTVEDEYMRGNMIAKDLDVNDNSDIDVDANQLAKIRYDFNFQVEGWMPLPARLVPTILGEVHTLSELDTREVFEVIKPNFRGIE